MEKPVVQLSRTRQKTDLIETARVSWIVAIGGAWEHLEWLISKPDVSL